MGQGERGPLTRNLKPQHDNFRLHLETATMHRTGMFTQSCTMGSRYGHFGLRGVGFRSLGVQCFGDSVLWVLKLEVHGTH